MGRADTRKIDPRDIRRVEITPRGEYWLQARRLTLAQVESELVRTHQQNPRLIVDIAADRRVPWDYVAALLDACSRRGILQVCPRTAPAQHP